MPEAGLELDWRPSGPVSLGLTLGVYRHGGGDPAFRVDGSALWRTSLTPDGPATIRIAEGTGGTVKARAWGPGARWLLDMLPAQLGAFDADQLPTHVDGPGAALLRDIATRHPGLRIGRGHRVFEALVPAVLEQKVVGKEAHRAWRTLLYQHGTPAPGPAPRGMRVFPAPKVWSRIPSWDWHRAGVEGIRARTIMNAAAVAARLEEIMELSTTEADVRLRSLPGIGPWTSAEVRQRAAGDPDAISVGDYNLPKQVGWTLAGERGTDDAGMLELLAPYQGQRYRVQRLIELGGSAPPRRGPRLPVREYRGF
jgi:3-methyladenine DNA glycosylase/8-oxoguanine DNA glycosylase